MQLLESSLGRLYLIALNKMINICINCELRRGKLVCGLTVYTFAVRQLSIADTC